MSVSSISPRINLPSITSTPSVSRAEPRPEVRAPERGGVESPFARDCFQSGCCAKGPDLQGGVDKAQTPAQLKKQLGQMLGQVLEQLGFKREDIDKALQSLGLGEQGKTDSANSCGGAPSDAGKAGGACGAPSAGGSGSCGDASSAKKPMSIEELLQMLMQNPALLKQVLQNPQMLQQLMQNPESFKQDSKSASPIGELSGISRFSAPIAA
jgi:hypothetical protein